MWLKCPYCRSSLEVTNIAPGHYRPRCRSCQKLFYVGVPEKESDEPIVVKTLQQIRREMRATLSDRRNKTEEADMATAVGAAATLPVAARLDMTYEQSPAAGDHATATNGQALQTMPAEQFSHPPIDDRPAPEQEAGQGSVVPSTADQRDAPRLAPSSPTSLGGEAATLATVNVLPEDEPVEDDESSVDDTMPQSLHGYRLVRILGKGAMGAVYLARQTSLDREVAVKTIQSKWASNPVFISRFTREAYAAAQLTHHNIVQIYDMGEDSGVHFFSMELIDGQSLGSLLKEAGRLDRDVAVGYVLQAARGLHYAHQRGIIHRDIKPDNLMINQQGVVKVADLGLVKLPDESESSGRSVDPELLKRRSVSSTVANMSMGTPAYMPPEQARDASSVDHRADIYSLGCTFYALLTGRPPFEGATALEVITKHLEQPIVRPDAVAKHVPKQLADVTMRMVAKEPEQRASNLGEVIKKLEEYLGMGPTGAFSPGQQHVDTLEDGVTRYNSASAGPLRKSCFLATAGILVAVMIGGLIFGMGGLFIGALASTVVGPIAYFIVAGVLSGNFMYRKLREFLFSSSLIDWLKYLGGAMLTLLVLTISGTLLAAVGGAILATGIAAGYYFVVDRTLQKQRSEPLEQIAQLLKSLRLRGLDEIEVRTFVVKYAGAEWEEAFEDLFGYQAKIHARDFSSRTGGVEKSRKFAAWRDPIVRYCDQRISAAKAAKERRHLASVEAKRLQAEGTSEEEAEAIADRAAQAMIDEAIHQRETAIDPEQANSADPRHAASERQSRMRNMLSEAQTAKPKQPISIQSLLAIPFSLLTGAPLRIIAGAALLTGCVMWLQHNNLLNGQLISAALDSKRTYQTLDLPMVSVAMAT
ncbi:MAG: protein kinase, partial [Blastopirellula sp. JB062]